LLAEQGHQVTVFERADRIEPVGAGLLLQPSGQRILDEMGLLDEVANYAGRVDRLLGHTAKGRLVLDLVYQGLRPELVGLGVHRAMLIDVLLARVATTENCDLVCEADVETLDRRGGRWFLGEADGDQNGPFDLVVLANGARSELRERTGLVKRATEYTWGALWAIVPDQEQVYPATLRQFYEGVGTFLGFLPTGSTRTDDTELVSVFWSVRNDQAEELLNTPFDEFRQRMLRLAPEAGSILNQLTSWDQFVHARYMDVMLTDLHGDGLACIGDTAHAMSPQLGQGVTMALQDAEALSNSLGSALGKDALTLEDALRTYTRKRRSTLRYYQFANRAATWFFQGDSKLFGATRDLFFGPLNYLPLYRGQMLRTLAGFKTGFFTSKG
jgi:2-polyprenyl-6-methoxyphenol hydroxylase-like FAD-dependent oxidoreductase